MILRYIEFSTGPAKIWRQMKSFMRITVVGLMDARNTTFGTLTWPPIELNRKRKFVILASNEAGISMASEAIQIPPRPLSSMTNVARFAVLQANSSYYAVLWEMMEDPASMTSEATAVAVDTRVIFCTSTTFACLVSEFFFVK